MIPSLARVATHALRVLHFSAFIHSIICFVVWILTINSLNFFLSTQAILVPLQGLMNAVVYAWTSWDFLSAMSSRHTNNHYSSSKSDWQEEGSVEGTEENEEQETDVEEDEEYLMHSHYSILSSNKNNQI